MGSDFLMFEKLVHNLKQIVSDGHILHPSILIPQEKINEVLPGFVQDVPEIRHIRLDCRQGAATLSLELHYKLFFSVNIEIKPKSISLEDDVVHLKFWHLPEISFHSSRRFVQWVLQGVSYAALHIFDIDLLEKAAARIPALGVQGEELGIQVRLDDLMHEAAMAKAAKLISKAVELDSFDFVDNGVRISFQVLPQIFE
ncbi:MAG: hypothetical protein P8184_08155 [Calditrichia bacterium]